MSRTVAAFGSEFDLIERFTSAFDRPAAPYGPGDDAALLTVRPGQSLVVSTDTLVEHVHFSRDWSSAADIGHKALAVSLSDMAAMVAAPSAFLVSLSIPVNLSLQWFDQCAQSMASLARNNRCVLVGGNLTRADQLSITVTIHGETSTPTAWLRKNARVGQAIWIWGTLGASAAGLDGLQRSIDETADWSNLLTAHRRPWPQLEAIERLRGLGGARSGAAIDVSDGLLQDLSHVLRASSCGAVIDSNALPLDSQLEPYCRKFGLSMLDLALAGGEDYALIATYSPDSALLGATRIGYITDQGGLIVTRDGQPIPLPTRLGHRHFS